MFKEGTITAYVQHMFRLHGCTSDTMKFIAYQIELVCNGVRDVRLGDDAVILLDGLIK